ncbi:MAG: M43 family zinc metalloprotease [Bacteroidota bacterium]
MKQKIYTFLACGLLVLGTQKANAQLNCGTDEMMHKLFEQYPGLQQEHEQLLANSRQNALLFKQQNPDVQSAPTYIIPIVFHIIHQYGVEYISDAQILDAVSILNEDFRKLNADTSTIQMGFDSIAADSKIEFRLPTKDPEGNCTNGIDRIYSHETNQANDEAKLNQWDRAKYLNVWVVKTIGDANVAGYAYYPSAVTGILYTRDGIIILHDYIGSIGTGAPNTSRALTHEIGHYLSLSHTWGSNNSPNVACGDDGIADTPPTKGYVTCPAPGAFGVNWSFCALQNQPPDTVPENVENFMEYSYCSKMFTNGQRDAMWATLQSAVASRNNLWKPANLLATGSDSASQANPPTCIPVADFTPNRYFICQGGTVTFTDRSWRAPVTSRVWTFTNGTPATSTAASPTVTFSTWGWQHVWLTVTNSAGSDTCYKHNLIFVSPPWYDYFGGPSESFENSNFAQQWIVINDEQNMSKWQQSSSAGYTGSNSIMVNSFGEDNYVVDEVITPSYNLSSTSGMTLTYKYAAASSGINTFVVDETLRVYTSVDCGVTWILRQTITGANLCTAGYSQGFFVPSSPSHWQTATVTLPSQVQVANVRFKFQYTTGSSPNNIYIDDININGVGVGESEIQNYNFGLNVYPNPSKGGDLINIAYTLVNDENITISMIDMLGREVLIVNKQNQTAGDKVVSIDKNALNLKAGMYMVKISNGSSYSAQKLSITN